MKYNFIAILVLVLIHFISIEIVKAENPLLPVRTIKRQKGFSRQTGQGAYYYCSYSTLYPTTLNEPLPQDCSQALNNNLIDASLGTNFVETSMYDTAPGTCSVSTASINNWNMQLYQKPFPGANTIYRCKKSVPITCWTAGAATDHFYLSNSCPGESTIMGYAASVASNQNSLSLKLCIGVDGLFINRSGPNCAGDVLVGHIGFIPSSPPNYSAPRLDPYGNTIPSEVGMPNVPNYILAQAIQSTAIAMGSEPQGNLVKTGDYTTTQVRLFNAAGNILLTFFPFGGSYIGGVKTALADINADGFTDLILAMGAFTPGSDSNKIHDIRIISGQDGNIIASQNYNVEAFSNFKTIQNINPYNSITRFSGLGGIGVGNVKGGSKKYLVAGSNLLAGLQPGVRVLSNPSDSVLWYQTPPVHSFAPYGQNQVPVNIAVGDIGGDGVAEIVTAVGGGAAPHVKIFDAVGNLLREFFAYYTGFNGGVRIAIKDVNQDGKGDIITAAGPGGGPHVKVFSGLNNSLITEFFADPATCTSGVYVAPHPLYADRIITSACGVLSVRSGLTGARFSSDPLNGINVWMAQESQLTVPPSVIGVGIFTSISAK